jgi:WD40 repeat protein
MVSALNQPPASPDQSHPWIGRLIGDGDRYRLDERLGGGGMGDVFLATDTRLGKSVALKLLRESLAIADDLDLRERFERECGICAALKSAHIVQVSDYGVTAEGYPFYVMEYLQGQTLSQLLALQPRLSVGQTCTIMTQVCAGLQLAHEGAVLWNRETGTNERIKVVHRDLKPANILLVPTALGDLVKIIDFGIAKIRSLQTEYTSVTSVFLGTCHYAAPEQFAVGQEVDERADIYSLGMILYEMLAGVDPFGFDFRHQRVSNEAWLNAHAFQPATPLRSQPGCESIPPRLAAVVMQCLEKSPGDRIASVSDLSQALQVAMQAAGSDATLPGVNLTGTGSNHQTAGLSMPVASSQLPPRAVKSARVPFRWRGLLVGSSLVLALLAGLYAVPRWSRSPLVSTASSSINAPKFSLVKTLTGSLDTVWSVVVGFDNQTLVSGSEDHIIRVWNLNSGQVSRVLSGHTDSVRSVSLSADGQVLASGSGDKTIKLWNVQTGTLLRTLEYKAPVWSVALSRDGQTLVSGSEDGTIKLWNVPTGKLLRTLSDHTGAVYSVALSRDGQTFASGSADKTVKLWSLQTGTLLRTLEGHGDVVRAVAFSPDGLRLASASWDKTAKIWNPQTGELLHTLSGHGDRVVSVAFNFDGQLLATASLDQTVRVWDSHAGTQLQNLSGHSDWATYVTTSPSDQMIVSSGKDKTIQIWR